MTNDDRERGRGPKIQFSRLHQFRAVPEYILRIISKKNRGKGFYSLHW